MASCPRKHHLSLALAGLILLASSASVVRAASVSELIGKLKASDEAAQLEAIQQLGAQGAKAAPAVAPLSALLKGGSPQVRAEVAKALGKIGEPALTAVPELAALLKDDDNAVRRQVVATLLALRPGPKVMIPLFVQLMDDSDAAVQMRVVSAIAEAGAPAVPGLIEGLKNDKTAYWACIALRQIGPAAKAAAPALAERLQDPRPDVRIQAALALGALEEVPPAVLSKIATALDDPQTQTAATFVLGQLGKVPAPAEKQIRANAKGDDRFLGTVSLWTLARVHPEDKELRRQATEQLVARLKDQDPFVRVAAARALAALPPAPEITIPIWEKALKDADTTTVHHALDALASLGERAVPRLIDILKEHKQLRVEVIYTLAQMGPAAAAATDALAALVADSDLNVATEAILALGKIGPAAKSAVPALCAALQQKEEVNAHAIVLTLGEIGPDAATAEPQVLQAMQSKDLSLAVIAATTLPRIKGRSAETAAQVVPILVAGLSDALPETRASAAEGLAELGPLARPAVPALKEASGDSSRAVREAAGAALKAVE